ncbi:MAG: EFR1 family ferrodoxin [Lachnospiraceae bacterium]
MIIYFSGTGNSEYAAKRIGQEIGDEVLNLFEKIRNSDFSELHSERPWVMVAPTYAWRIPRIVQDWLERTALSGNKRIYFVMTCGENIGNAGKYLKKLCEEKKLDYQGCMGITMPENYIAMFPVPEKEQALSILQQTEGVIDRAARLIKAEEKFPQPSISIGDKLISGIVNQLFYPTCVHAKKFAVTDACISCGKCSSVCPTSNILLKQGKPVWGKNCTHCMACICRCPQEAIEYGKRSQGKPRYVCPLSAEGKSR